MPHWNPVAGRYAAPWVMAPTNTRIVRKSNAMLGDKYGGLPCYFLAFRQVPTACTVHHRQCQQLLAQQALPSQPFCMLLTG